MHSSTSSFPLSNPIRRERGSPGDSRDARGGEGSARADETRSAFLPGWYLRDVLSSAAAAAPKKTRSTEEPLRGSKVVRLLDYNKLPGGLLLRSVEAAPRGSGEKLGVEPERRKARRSVQRSPSKDQELSLGADVCHGDISSSPPLHHDRRLRSPNCLYMLYYAFSDKSLQPSTTQLKLNRVPNTL